MSANGWLSGRQRNVLYAIVALGLLAAPLWVPALHLDDPTYTYERTEIVVDDEDGITYAGPFGEQPRHLSDDVACTQAFEDYRICALERQVLSQGTIPSGMFTTNPDLSEIGPGRGQYRYVQLDGSTYETELVVNESVQNDDGLHRLDLSLDSVPAEDVLDSVAHDATTDHPEIQAVVREAARTGSATTHTERDVPAIPLYVENEGYYGVSLADRTDPAPTGVALGGLLPVAFPFVGLFLLYRVVSTVEVRYRDAGRFGDDDRYS